MKMRIREHEVNSKNIEKLYFSGRTSDKWITLLQKTRVKYVEKKIWKTRYEGDANILREKNAVNEKVMSINLVPFIKIL